MADWVSLGAAAVVAVILAPVVVHRLAGRRDRQNARRQAASRFHDAVLAELHGLYPLPFEWPKDIATHLEKVAPSLASAVDQYRRFLPWWERPGFDKAWWRYRSDTGRKIDLQNYHHYMAFSNNRDPKSMFQRNVAALLAYAKV